MTTRPMRSSVNTRRRRWRTCDLRDPCVRVFPGYRPVQEKSPVLAHHPHLFRDGIQKPGNARSGIPGLFYRRQPASIPADLCGIRCRDGEKKAPELRVRIPLKSAGLLYRSPFFPWEKTSFSQPETFFLRQSVPRRGTGRIAMDRVRLPVIHRYCKGGCPNGGAKFPGAL